MLRLAVMLCLLAGAARADWTFDATWTDPLDGIETRVASTTNAQGHTLHLYRNGAGRVYVLFALSDETGPLAASGTVATLTPEGFAPKDIEARSERGRIIEYAVSDERYLRDRLWHGEGQSPAFGTFHDMLEAPQVTALFRLADDSTATATWAMDGAATPIAQALGISMDGTPAGTEWEDAAAQALLAAMTACQFPSLDVICIQRVSTCGTAISEDRDIAAFDACVAAD